MGYLKHIVITQNGEKDYGSGATRRRWKRSQMKRGLYTEVEE